MKRNLILNLSLIILIFFKVESEIKNINEVVEVITYVGSQDSLYLNDIGTNSLFHYPEGIIISNNELFALIAEYGTNLIRKVILSTYIVSTLVGSTYGYKDGIGTNAMFNNPMDICLTNDDSIAYVIEYNSPKIRRIEMSTLNVTTLVGSSNGYQDGIGTNVKFYSPKALSISPDNSFILIADNSNNMIRKLIISTNNVTTLAGKKKSGSSDGIGLNSSFYGPNGISISPDGIYCLVSDTYNNLIRKIIISTAEVTTLVGNTKSSLVPIDGIGTNARLKYPECLKISSDGSYALINDKGFYMIRKLVISTLSITSVAGGTEISGTKVGFSNGIGTNALFYSPSGISIPKDNSYALISDFSSNLIRKIILSQSLVSTFVGRTNLDTVIGKNASFDYPYSISLSPDNSYALITDSKHSIVRYIDLLTSEVKQFVGRTTSGNNDGFGTNAAFFSPSGISISSSGEFALVTDRNNYRIRKIILSTKIVSTLAGSKYGLSNGIGTNVLFGELYDISISPDESYALIADQGNNQIRYITLSTNEVTTITGRLTAGYQDGIGSNALFDSPKGLSIAPNGIYAFICDTSNNMIRKLIITTKEVTTIAGVSKFGRNNGIGTSASFYSPYSISFSYDDTYAYITDGYNYQIRKIIISTLEVTTIAGNNKSGFVDGIGTNARFYTVAGISISKTGSYSLVVDIGNNCVRKLIITDQSPTILPTSLSNTKSESEKSNNTEVIIIPVVICSFLLVVGIIIGLYFFHKKKSTHKKIEKNVSLDIIQQSSDESQKCLSVTTNPVKI